RGENRQGVRRALVRPLPIARIEPSQRLHAHDGSVLAPPRQLVGMLYPTQRLLVEGASLVDPAEAEKGVATHRKRANARLQVAAAQSRVIRATHPLGGRCKAPCVEVDEPAFETDFLPHANIAGGARPLEPEVRLRVGLIPATDTEENDAETRVDPRLVVWGPD